MLRDIGFVCPIRIHQPISRLKNGGRRSGETHQRATSLPLPQTALFRLLFHFRFVRTTTESPHNHPPPQPPAAPPPPAPPPPPQPVTLPRSSMRYPRIYTGRQLAMLAMPLGGIAAGSISLGGRGQLRDWEIFNRPDKGRSPEYAFASIWAQAGSRKPVAHVLEARLMPPYEGPDGLGPNNAPGLSPPQSAR